MSILINLIGFYSFLNNTELVKKYLNILIETLKLSDSINKRNIGRWLGDVLDKSKKTSDENIFNFVVNMIEKEEDIINSYEYLLIKLKNSKYEYYVEKNDLDKAFKISKEINILPIISDLNPNWSDVNEFQTFGFLSDFHYTERNIF